MGAAVGAGATVGAAVGGGAAVGVAQAASTTEANTITRIKLTTTLIFMDHLLQFYRKANTLLINDLTALLVSFSSFIWRERSA